MANSRWPTIIIRTALSVIPSIFLCVTVHEKTRCVGYFTKIAIAILLAAITLIPIPFSESIAVHVDISGPQKIMKVAIVRMEECLGEKDNGKEKHR